MVNQLKFAVTPAQVEAARSRLAEAGFPMLNDSGTIEEDGYRIGYTLADRVLVLEVLAKPRLVPMMVVKARIRSMVAVEGIVELG